MSEVTSHTSHTSYQGDTWVRNWNDLFHTDSTTRQQGGAYVYTNQVVGSKLPNWQAVIRSGGNATTSLSGSLYTVKSTWCTIGQTYLRTLTSPISHYGTEYYGYPEYTGALQSLSGAPPDVVTTVTNRCIRKFLDRAEAIRSSVEAGQDFGEYEETLNGLINPLSQLRRHVLGYFPRVKKLKGLYRDARSMSKALADTYLEWTFGWKPLASDIADAYVGLQNRSRFSDRQAIRVSAKDRFQLPNPSKYILRTTSIGNVTQSSRQYGEYTVVMYGMIRTGADKSGLVSRAQMLQLDLPHFVPTIWDLIPYSFIVDYFTNVGEVIRALSVVDSEFMWGGQDVITEWVQDFAPPVFEPAGQPSDAVLESNWADGGSGTFTRRDIVRGVLSPSGLIPRIQVSLPLSDKPWINIGALLLSRIADVLPLI